MSYKDKKINLSEIFGIKNETFDYELSIVQAWEFAGEMPDLENMTDSQLTVLVHLKKGLEDVLIDRSNLTYHLQFNLQLSKLELIKITVLKIN